MTRSFAAAEPANQETPLLIGLMGPPGGGKTFSGLRLASGIVSVRGGDIRLIDTERRAHKYRDSFRYKVAPFDPPFRPSDFLDAIHQQIADGAGCIIVDSASDEHEGIGGVLDWKEAEVDRMAGAGADWKRRESLAMAGWIAPKRDRLKFINGIQRITVPLILCFRAREKTRPIKDDKGKTVPTNIGWQPIAPSEIVHAMDLTCLLQPRADGVPTWRSDKVGEDFIIKMPQYLRPFIQEGKALDEEMGAAFARWAKGTPALAAPPASDLADLTFRGDEAAREGMTTLGAWWKALSAADRKTLGTDRLEAWKRAAQQEEVAAS